MSVIRDNFCQFCTKTYVVTLHLNRLVETVQMKGHNIRFKDLNGYRYFGIMSVLIIVMASFPLTELCDINEVDLICKSELWIKRL